MRVMLGSCLELGLKFKILAYSLPLKVLALAPKALILLNLALVLYLMALLTSSGILPFLKNSRSMTPVTWQAAVDDEEQRPQDILEAAVDDRRQAAVDVEEQRPQLQDIFEAAINGNHV